MDTDLLQDDLLLLSQFAHFPHKMAGRAIAADELNQYFGTVQIHDLISALQHYEKDGYFQVEIKLSPDYLKQERHKADKADLSGPDYDENYELGRLFDKVDAQSPLSSEDVSYLISKLSLNKTEQYLQFRLTKINRQKFQNELDEFITKHREKLPDIAPGLPRKQIRKPDFRIVSEQLEQGVPHVAEKHQAMIILQGKVLKIRLDGEFNSQPLWRYQSTKADTLRACQRLTRNPDKPLNRDRLAVTGKTSLKDLQSNMGFKGIIREIFIFHDKANETLKLNKSPELDSDQYVAVRDYLVKLSKDKNSVA